MLTFFAIFALPLVAAIIVAGAACLQADNYTKVVSAACAAAAADLAESELATIDAAMAYTAPRHVEVKLATYAVICSGATVAKAARYYRLTPAETEAVARFSSFGHRPTTLN